MDRVIKSHESRFTIDGVTLEVEPADPSVGIMAEGFAAWEESGAAWCNLDDIITGACTWFDNESGEECSAPPKASVVEARLRAFAEAYYQRER